MSLSRYRNPFDSSPLVTETIGHGTIGLANIYLKTRIFSFLHGASFTPRTRLLWPQRVTFNRSFFSPPFRVLENKSILPKWIWKWNQYISLYRDRYKLSFYIVHIYLLINNFFDGQMPRLFAYQTNGDPTRRKPGGRKPGRIIERGKLPAGNIID